MKKVWGYILGASAFLFAGIATGLYIARKSAGDQYKIGINKLKQKGKDNRQESELDVNLAPLMNPGRVISDKRQERIRRRNEKKKDKALRRLNKLT